MKATSNGRFRGALRLALAFATLLAALSMVVWRQSRALETLRALDALRTERAMSESERADLQHRIQTLESRAHVVAVARTRLGMHVPGGSEIVILPLVQDGSAPGAGVLASGSRRGGLLSWMGSGEGGEAEPGGADARSARTPVGGR